MDYAFIRRDCESDNASILVVKDRESRAIQATVLRMKGASLGEAGEKATEAIENLSHTAGKLMIKRDNENALLDLRNEVIRRLPTGVLPVGSPVGESQYGLSQGQGTRPRCPNLLPHQTYWTS